MELIGQILIKNQIYFIQILAVQIINICPSPFTFDLKINSFIEYWIKQGVSNNL